MLSMKIVSKENEVRKGIKNPTLANVEEMTASGKDLCVLSASDFTFEDGDQILVHVDEKETYLMIKLDETIDTSFIYVPNHDFRYTVTIYDEESAFPDHRFKGPHHALSVRYATEDEIKQYRNLSLNPHDQKDFDGFYPHASANVETRNESVFFACNAIDGTYANNGHGNYPYQSWGINRQADAKLTVDFGRKVKVDKVGITLRVDFPHDSYWTKATLNFSDGTKEVVSLEKTAERQFFTFEAKEITQASISNMIKAEDESPFPALTQIEFYGTNV